LIRGSFFGQDKIRIGQFFAAIVHGKCLLPSAHA